MIKVGEFSTATLYLKRGFNMRHYSFIILLVSALYSLFDQSFAMYKVNNEIVIEESATLSLKNNRLLQIINNIKTKGLDQSLVTISATLFKDKTGCAITVTSTSQTTMSFGIMVNETNKKMMLSDSFREEESYYILDPSTQELVLSVEGDLTLGGVSFIKNKQPILRNCSITAVSGATECSAAEFFSTKKLSPKKIVPIKQNNDEDIYQPDKVDELLIAEQTDLDEATKKTSSPIAPTDSDTNSDEEQKTPTGDINIAPAEQKPSLRTRIIRWLSGDYNKVEPSV